jgi:predicted nucleotidyltransferase
MGAHGMPRYTGDIDLFFRATVDLLNAISGASFDDAWRSRVVKEIGGVDVPLIGLDQLIANKAASGRLKNQADLETLRRNDANKK